MSVKYSEASKAPQPDQLGMVRHWKIEETGGGKSRTCNQNGHEAPVCYYLHQLLQ